MFTCLSRWATLKEALVDKRSKLGESQSLQQFIRDADDVEGWINEKMQTVQEESYKDPTNIQVTNTSVYIFTSVHMLDNYKNS